MKDFRGLLFEINLATEFIATTKQSIVAEW